MTKKTATKKKPASKEWSPTRVGVCDCGHTGGRADSQHGPRYAEGHGPCMVEDCECVKFSWTGWKEDK